MNLLCMASETSVPGADEFVPALVYVVIHANPPGLLSTVQYITNFYDQRLSGEEAYYWMQFCAAIAFIKTLRWIPTGKLPDRCLKRPQRLESSCSLKSYKASKWTSLRGRLRNSNQVNIARFRRQYDADNTEINVMLVVFIDKWERLISSGVTANRRIRMHFKMNCASQVKIMTYIVGLFTENFICSWIGCDKIFAS